DQRKHARRRTAEPRPGARAGFLSGLAPMRRTAAPGARFFGGGEAGGGEGSGGQAGGRRRAEPLARLLVEEMQPGGIGPDVHLIAGADGDALAAEIVDALAVYI